jgi:predicted outer membrane repeat protein
MHRLLAVAHGSAYGLHLIRRLGGCALAVFLGMLGAALLLALAGGRSAQAAPQVIFVNPGESIQAAIDGAAPGETIVVNAGTYTESLTLNKAVSLTGVSSATVIVRALADQRVLTATGAAVNSSVVISGLSLTGGNVTGLLAAGGGLLVTGDARPRLENLRIYSNTTAFWGGGIFFGGILPLTLKNVVVQSNTTEVVGGGAFLGSNAQVSGGMFAGNRCATDGCNGGGLYADNATVTGTLFLSNTSRANGGGLFSATGVTLTSASLVGNTCTQAGCWGAGLFTTGTLTANNTQFISNVAQGAGGGALALSTTVVINGLIQGNQCLEAICAGGGLWVRTLTLTGTAITSNTSMVEGGGVRVFGLALLNGGLFQANACLAANCNGGGLNAGNIVASGTHFIDNHALNGGGGGAYAFSAANISDGLFQSNMCPGSLCSGGGLYANNEITLTRTDFISNSSQGSGGGAIVFGPARLNGGLFRANTCLAFVCFGGGLRAGNIVASGTHFVSNQATTGGAGAFASTTAEISDGLLQGNACQNVSCQGGGVFANGSIVLTDTNFISNAAAAEGGAAVSTDIAMSGGLVQGNRCTQSGCTGGGMVATGVDISGTQFISNSAQVVGGAVVAANANIVGGLFERNACTMDGCQGGALWAAVSVIVQDTQFISNTARLGGGAVQSNGSGSLTGGLFQGNTCTQAGCTGGGLRASNGLTVSQTEFVQNTSRGSGGGVYAQGATTMNGGVFAGNACLESGCTGGGLRADANLSVSRTTFLRNRAQAYGGSLAHHSGTGEIVNNLFAGNSAASGGAALYLASGGAVDVLHNTVASPTVGSSAAIDVVSGTVQIIDTVVTSYSVGIRRIGGGSVFEDYNLFFGVASPKVGPMAPGSGVNDLSGDPRFENPAGDDYHLRRLSAALDNGADFAVNTDFEGDSRPQRAGFDVGYDEYINLAPSAAANSYGTAAEVPLVVAAPGVLNNDTDPNLEPLTAVLVSGPATGSLSLAPDGGFVYTPNVAFTGQVTFTYRASDGELVSPMATVTITVTPAALVAHKVYLPVALR